MTAGGLLRKRNPSVMNDQPFLLGVNYWPRRKAMYWWNDFDAGEVRDEFAMIRELNLDLVRIFLLWDDFQPAPNEIAREKIKHLTTVCDIAADAQLKLDVTFFTGHMSGPNWAPRWLLGEPRVETTLQVVSQGRVVKSGYRNFFTDAVALDAEKLLLRTIVGELKSHPALGMWNLGNEPDLFAQPPTYQAGRAWMREMTNVIRELDDAHPITCGLHVASLVRDNSLRVNEVYAETDVAVMHAYPMYADWARSPLDAWYVPFTCAAVSALCGKQTLMEEFGGCTAPRGEPSQTWKWNAYGEPRKQFMASEEDLAKYLHATLRNLHTVGATGALLWCFADYAQELWNRPPCDEARHERFFGLVRTDGSLKPHAEVLEKFAATRPTIQPIPEWARLDLNAETFYENPLENLKRAYEKFVELVG